MLEGPFYVCWLLSDSEILERYKKHGSSAFSTIGWRDECDSCETRSCSINNGFADEMRKIFIDTNEFKVIG